MTIAVTHLGTIGDDEFVLSDEVPTVDIVWAGGGNDLIADSRGEPWSTDFFYGQGGDDRLVSLSGFDRLAGGAGDDILKIRMSRYDANAVPGAPGSPEPDWHGFDVEAIGGAGEDTLRITNSDGCNIEKVGGTTFITTRFGGVITATGIEHFDFV